MLITAAAGCLLAGCAATGTHYTRIYNKAVENGKSITIVKDAALGEVNVQVAEKLKSLGYERVLYSSPQDGFQVLIKDVRIAEAVIVGTPHPYRIIVKYSKASDGRTRIDLVNGSPEFYARNQVEEDLGELEKLLRAE